MSAHYYTTREVAKMLGVGSTTILRRIHEGQIRWSNAGTTRRPRIRISEDDLHAWLEAARSDPSPVLRRRVSALSVPSKAAGGVSPRYYSTEQVAKILGVSPTAIRRRIREGGIRWINVGTSKRPRVRISEKDFEAWVASQASREPGTERRPRRAKWDW